MPDEPAAPAVESAPPVTGDPLSDPIAKIAPPKPAEPATPAPDAPQPEPVPKKSILEFEPEPFSLDQGKPKPPKPEEKADPPEGKPADPAPDSEPKLEGGPEGMRNKIKELAAEKETFASELATLRTEREALEARLEELRGSSEETAAKLKEIEERRGIMDPMQHPEVRKLAEEKADFAKSFKAKIKQIASDMGVSEGGALYGSDGDAFTALVSQYEAVGQIGDPGYSERHSALKEHLEDTFPENHRDVLKLLREGSEATSKWVQLSKREQDLIKDLSDKGAQLQHAESQQLYEKGMQGFEATAKQWLNPPADMAENSPHSPRVALKRLVDESPEVAGRWDSIKKMLKTAMAPIAPLSAEQLGAMTDEEAAQYLSKRMQSRQEVSARLHSIAGEAYLSHAILPSILEERDELRRELDSFRDGTPEPKRDMGQHEPRKEGEPKSIKEFVPENPLLAKVSARG